jgi:hypothetical protein
MGELEKLQAEQEKDQRSLFETLGQGQITVSGIRQRQQARNVKAREAMQIDAMNRKAQLDTAQTKMAKAAQAKKEFKQKLQDSGATLPTEDVRPSQVAKAGGGDPSQVNLEDIPGGAGVQPAAAGTAAGQPAVRFEERGSPGDPDFGVDRVTQLSQGRGLALLDMLFGRKRTELREQAPAEARARQEHFLRQQEAARQEASDRRSRLQSTINLSNDIKTGTPEERFAAARRIRQGVESSSPQEQAAAYDEMTRLGLHSRDILQHQADAARLGVEKAEFEIQGLEAAELRAAQDVAARMAFRAVGSPYDPADPNNMDAAQLSTALGTLTVGNAEDFDKANPGRIQILVDQLHGQTSTNPLNGQLFFYREVPSKFLGITYGKEQAGYSLSLDDTSRLLLTIWDNDKSKDLRERSVDKLEELTGLKMQWSEKEGNYVRPGLLSLTDEDIPLMPSWNRMVNVARQRANLLTQSQGQYTPSNPKGNEGAAQQVSEASKTAARETAIDAQIEDIRGRITGGRKPGLFEEGPLRPTVEAAKEEIKRRLERARAGRPAGPEF